MKTKPFHLMKYDLSGHWRSNEVFFYLKIILPKLFRNDNIMKILILIKWNRTSKVIEGHLRPLLCLNPSWTFIYELILMKFCIFANIMKTQLFFIILYYGEVSCFFSSDLDPNNLDYVLLIKDDLLKWVNI